MNNKQASQLISLFLRRICTILLGIGLCLTSCTDDPLEADRPDGPDDKGTSLVSCIEFDNSKLEGSLLLQKDEVICCFKMVDPGTATFEIVGVCREFRGKEEITLEENLSVGDMYITHIKYHGERDKPGSELRSYGLGYLLHVKGTGKKTKISVDGTYDEEAGFVGTGTAESPYRINCGEDLLHLQGLVNKDITGSLFKGSHFMQTTDIDMHAACTFLNGEYGWLPIGYTNTRPFRGYPETILRETEEVRQQREA